MAVEERLPAAAQEGRQLVNFQQQEESCVLVAVNVRPLIDLELAEGCKPCLHITPGEPQVGPLRTAEAQQPAAAPCPPDRCRRRMAVAGVRSGCPSPRLPAPTICIKMHFCPYHRWVMAHTCSATTTSLATPTARSLQLSCTAAACHP